MNNVVRVSVTFPPDLLKRFDEIIKRAGYTTRSKAIQDSAKMLISEFECLHRVKKTLTGVLTVIYDPNVRGINESITNIQHEHGDVVLATMHIPLSEKENLEAIVMKGKTEDVRKITTELKTKKGIKMARLTVIST